MKGKYLSYFSPNKKSMSLLVVCVSQSFSRYVLVRMRMNVYICRCERGTWGRFAVINVFDERYYRIYKGKSYTVMTTDSTVVEDYWFFPLQLNELTYFPQSFLAV